MEKAEARRKTLEDEKRQKVEEHLNKVKSVREAEGEKEKYEQAKNDLEEKLKAAEQRRQEFETSLKEKIQARQAIGEQVRLRNAPLTVDGNKMYLCL